MSSDNFDSLATNAAALRAEMEELSSLADTFGNKLVSSFASAIVHGKSLSDIVKSMLQSLAQAALTAAIKPLGNLIGDLFSGLFANAKGNAFAGGQLVPFADGGIVNSPTLFALRGGMGLMGEAGPEAVIPLARGPDGSLGVRGGGSTSVTVNIATPSPEAFAQSQAQVAALVTRALTRARRNA